MWIFMFNKKTIIRYFGTVCIAILTATSPGNSEFPLDYKNWPYRQSDSKITTYKKDRNPDSEVVREFTVYSVVNGAVVPLRIVGYAPSFTLQSEKKPLEIRVLIDPKYYLDQVSLFRSSFYE